MMTNFSHIRLVPAAIDDLPRIAALARIIWHECYPGIITAQQIDYMLDRMYDVDLLRAEVFEQGVRYDILVDNGTAIGFVAYCPGSIEGEAKIHKLYLRREYQGRGLGSRMLRHATREAQAAGYTTVILNVNKHNAQAIKAYLRNGFTIREAVVVDIGGGYVMDDYVMTCALSNASGASAPDS